MSLIPTWPLVVGAMAIGGTAGFALEHTLKSAEIAEIKLARANEITAASQVALEDYKIAAGVVADAALGARADISAVTAQLTAIRKGQKNAPPPPLPPDCRPGPVRLRNLADTAAAADKAILRPDLGGGLRPDRRDAGR